MQLIISQFSLPFSSYVSQYTCVAPTKHLHVPHRLFCFSEQRNKLEAADLKKETNPKKVSLWPLPLKILIYKLMVGPKNTYIK